MNNLFAFLLLAIAPVHEAEDAAANRVNEVIEATALPRIIIAEAVLTKQGEFITEEYRQAAERAFVKRARPDSYAAITVSPEGSIRISLDHRREQEQVMYLEIKPIVRLNGGTLDYSCSLSAALESVLAAKSTKCRSE